MLVQGLKLNLINQPFLSISLGLVKVSLCLSFLRFAPSQAWRRFVIGLLIFTVANTLVGFFTILFQCVPLHGLWTPGVKLTCLKPKSLWGLLYFTLGE